MTASARVGDRTARLVARAERLFPDIRYWNELDRGGHFAAFEQPETFVGELRDFFRLVREPPRRGPRS